MGLNCVSPSGGVVPKLIGARATAAGVDMSTPPVMISWQLIEYDTNGFFDLANFPTRCTVPFEGVYLFGGRVKWSPGSSWTPEADVRAGWYFGGAQSDEIDTRMMTGPSFADITGQCLQTVQHRFNINTKIELVLLTRESPPFPLFADVAMWIEYRGSTQ